MPEVIFPGPEGRLEGRFHPGTRPRAPVATPIHWDELADRALKPDRWTVKTIAARIDSEGDPWKGMSRRARALPKRWH